MLNTVTIKTIDSTWTNAFSEEELEKIVYIGENKVVESSILGNGSCTEDIRKSKNSWIYENDAPWLYDRLTKIANKLNSNFYNFSLEGLEALQYTIYSDNSSHYDWHMDMIVGNPLNDLNTPIQRKLTLVLQLDSEENYEGGNLEIFAGGSVTPINKEKGSVVAFPSFALHRVTPVTKGTRRTLVAWFQGPDWR